MSRSTPLILCLVAAATLGGCDRPDEPNEPVKPVAEPSAATSEPTPPQVANVPAAPRASIESATTESTGSPVRFEMIALSGSGISGTLTAVPTGNGVRLQGRLARSDFGAEHAIHVHEIGDCSAPDGTSAGDHFNPAGLQHGHPDRSPHHAGDLPNLKADPDGQLVVDLYTDGLQLGTGGATDILGRAVVLHAQPDDYATQPAGASGARVACGVISNSTGA